MTVEVRGRMVYSLNIKAAKRNRKILDTMSRDLEELARDMDRAGDKLAAQCNIAALTVESARKALATFITAAEIAAEQAQGKKDREALSRAFALVTRLDAQAKEANAQGM